MDTKQHNDIEIALFKTIPPDKLPDFIEKNGEDIRERIRLILQNSPDETDLEIIENLKQGYKGI